MKTSIVVLAVITVSAPFGLTAAAQTYDAPPMAVPDGVAGLPPFEILGIVRSKGFRPLGPPVRRGRFYVVHAMEPGGVDIRVVVDAGSGRIFSVAPMDDAPPGYRAAWAYEREAGYGWRPWYRRPGPYFYYYGPQEQSPNERIPAPTNVTPAMRGGPPVARSAALTPPTPLPRPRPVDGSVVSPVEATSAVSESAAQRAPSLADVPASRDDGNRDRGSSVQEKLGQGKVGEDKPVEASASKPALALPPVTPLD